MDGRMKRKNRRTFWFTLGLSLFLFLTGAGFLTVDYQGRKLSFGDSTPPLYVDRLSDGRAELELKAFGVEKSWDVTKIDEFVDFLCDFGCIPHT